MNRQVWKHPLVLTETPQKIALRGAEAGIVHFAVGTGGFHVWAEEEPESPEEQTRTVVIVGTGWDIPEGYAHRGTILDGPYVWHLYEHLGGAS